MCARGECDWSMLSTKLLQCKKCGYFKRNVIGARFGAGRGWRQAPVAEDGRPSTMPPPPTAEQLSGALAPQRAYTKRYKRAKCPSAIGISVRDACEKYGLSYNQLRTACKKRLVYRISKGLYDEPSISELVREMERSSGAMVIGRNVRPNSKHHVSRSPSPIKNHHYII